MLKKNKTELELISDFRMYFTCSVNKFVQYVVIKVNIFFITKIVSFVCH